jgi:hypothetical protein
MKITLTPTGKFESVEGHNCRIWEGEYQGHKVVAMVAMIGQIWAARSAPSTPANARVAEQPQDHQGPEQNPDWHGAILLCD